MIMNRKMKTDCLVGPPQCETLIGQIVRERLDLIVDPLNPKIAIELQLQFLPGGPLEKISERFFLYSGVKPEFQFPLQVNTTVSTEILGFKRTISPRPESPYLPSLKLK